MHQPTRAHCGEEPLPVTTQWIYGFPFVTNNSLLETIKTTLMAITITRLVGQQVLKPGREVERFGQSLGSEIRPEAFDCITVAFRVYNAVTGYTSEEKCNM